MKEKGGKTKDKEEIEVIKVKQMQMSRNKAKKGVLGANFGISLEGGKNIFKGRGVIDMVLDRYVDPCICVYYFTQRSGFFSW